MEKALSIASLLSGKSIIALALGTGLVWTLQASTVFALEPLDTFLDSAKERSFDTQEARAALSQRGSDYEQAWRELLPTVTGTIGYQYNQYEAIAKTPKPTNDPMAAPVLEDRVITPHHQRDATIAVELPIIDVATWARMSSSSNTQDAARAQVAASELDAQRATARAYYSVVATEAVIVTAQRSLEVAQKNRDLTQARFDAGTVTQIDVKRADAEVERNRQLVADAAYQAAIARRDLETVSGKQPSAGAPELEASLEPAAPLATFQRNHDALPQVRAARAEAEAAKSIHSAARAALLPTVKATFNERFTNAPGFGYSPYYNVGISASIKLDATLPSAAKGQAYAVEAARIKAARTRREAEDAIYGAWLDVTRQIEKSRATRAQLEASKLAAQLSRDRYEAGTATFVDLLIAERDVLSAEVERIRADADLNHARVALRLAAGQAAAKGQGQ